MTNDPRTSDDIERDIVDERAQMSDTINDLQKKFSVDAIVSDLGAMVRNQGGDLGRSISNTVGRNPVAVVLVGVGLAWLFLGRDRRPSAHTNGQESRQSSGHRHKRTTSYPWDEKSLSKIRPDDGRFRNEDSHWYGDDKMSGDYRPSDRDTKAGAKKPSGKDDAADGMMGTVRNVATSVGDAVSDAAGGLGHAASDLTKRLSDGLENLSEEAKSRVLSARRAAYEARLSSEAVMNRGSRVASGFFEDQPLVVGALAVALGAAIGGALPRSKIEDDTMGDSRDQLFVDAQALFLEERDKAMAAARMAATDAKAEIKDMGSDLADLLPEGKTVGDVIVDRASDAATRVLGRATGDVAPQKPARPRT